MIRKILVRLFLGGCVLFVIFVSTVAACIWLAWQEPSFYSVLRQQQFSENERDRAEQQLKAELESIERLTITSQQMKLSADSNGSFREATKSAFDLKTLNTEPQQLFHVQQDDLNAILSSRKYSGKDIKDLRAEISPDRIRLVGEVSVSDSSAMVLSIDFRINIVQGNRLKLEITGGQVGRLPIPLRWLLQNLPADVLPSARDVDFRFSDPKPHLLINTVKNSKTTPVLSAIQTSEGKITLCFRSPKLAN